MTSKGTSRSVFIVAAVSVLTLAVAPGLASAGTAAPGPSPFRALASPLPPAPQAEPVRELVPPPAASGTSLRVGLDGPRAIRLAEQEHEGGEEIYDGGGAAQVKEAGGSKEGADYSGPLGGLGIKCEDQKDLEALALGTYGNIIRAITNGPSVVKCAPKSEDSTEGGAPSGGSGASDDKGEKK